MADVLSLDNLCNGAAVEAFNEELVKVLENILDPNYPADKKRSLTLKVDITPTKERDMGVVSFTMAHSRPPRESSASTVTIGKHEGKPAAANVTPGINTDQHQIPGTRDGKVVNLDRQ